CDVKLGDRSLSYFELDRRRFVGIGDGVGIGVDDGDGE
ncbi:hypothetical protein A2U01_0081424, partial [Trifolium medium]|nr:hypothetical protein [Trifolium medium]